MRYRGVIEDKLRRAPEATLDIVAALGFALLDAYFLVANQFGN